MSSTILTNWTVYYADDAGSGGYKQIMWTGTTGTTTVNALYTALMDLFDNASQNDAIDSIPMKAITPTLYEIGSFDAGDDEPWFIDPESIKHLTGGGLNTKSWTRDLPGDGTGAIGIVQFPYSVGGGTDFAASDIGLTVTHTAGDSGTLLYFKSDGSTGTAWVRPDSNALADDWDSTGTSVSVSTGTGSGLNQTSAATSGEMIWSNIYSLGNIESNTTLYVSQNNSVIDNSEDSGSGFWWPAGHFDILVNTTFQDSLIDRGLLTVYARQYSKRYNYYTVDASAGGRSPIPLSTSDDPNNETGYRQMILSVTNDAFVAGDLIQDDSDSTIQGIVTSYDTSTNTLQYYLVGSLTDFSAATGTFASVSPGTGTGTAVNSTAVGPATTSFTTTFGLDQTLDIDNDGTNEDYSIIIDLSSSVSLADMNERLKYLTRRGETSTLDGIEGQQYIGLDYRVDYTTRSATPISEGSTVTQLLSDGSTATSEVVAHNTTDNYVMLRDTRGTLETGGSSNTLTDGSNTITMSTGATITAIAPSQEHPFGLFAGGNFFGARGVGLKNVPGTDANNYQLVDNDGITRTPPATVPITVSNTISGDRVAIFKTTGDNEIVDKNQFTIDASQSSGVAYIRIDEQAPNDTPNSGVIRVVIRDVSGNWQSENKYYYSSWTYTTYTEFTLDIAEHPSGTSAAYDATDTAYVPYVEEQATSTSVSKSITYVTDRFVLTVVRIVGIKPFKQKGQITSSGLPVTVVRETDSIYQ